MSRRYCPSTNAKQTQGMRNTCGYISTADLQGSLLTTSCGFSTSIHLQQLISTPRSLLTAINSAHISCLSMHHDRTSKQTVHIKPVQTSIRTPFQQHRCSFSIQHHLQHFPTQHHQHTFLPTFPTISPCLTGTDPACTASRRAASAAAACLWPVETRPTERRFSAGW